MKLQLLDVDNKKTIHPVYGKDMQNALSRLMYQETTKWFEAKMSAGWILLLYALLVVVPTTISDVQPAGILCSPWRYDIDRKFASPME